MPRQSRIGLAAAALIVAALGLWWWRGASPREVPSFAGAAAVLDEASESLEPALTAEDEIPSERATAAGAEVDPPALSAPAPTHVIRGRVVDERRYPVAGARVDLCARGVDAPVVSSGQDGRFEIEVAMPERSGEASGVRARDDAGRAGFTRLWMRPAEANERVEIDAGAIALLESHSLRVRVIDGNAPSPGARIDFAMGHERVFAGEAVADAAGEVVLDGLAPGVVHVDATSGGEAGHARAFVPEDVEAVVELVPLRNVEVLVVDAESGAGVEGARLKVMFQFPVPMALPGEETQLPGEVWSGQLLPAPDLTTDARGRAVVEGLGLDGHYELHVRAHGYEPIPSDSESGPWLDGNVQPLRVELERVPARTVRWPVIAGEVGVPSDGSVIALRLASGWFDDGEEPEPPPPGRIEGATLVAEVAFGQRFLARAPDGSLAELRVREGSEVGLETSFRRPRRIEVLVREASGAPLADAVAIAREGSGHLLCDEVSTGADGRAVLEGLHGGLANVYVGAYGKRSWHEGGSVDLEQGDGRIQLTIPALTPGRLRLIVDGRPELPPKFQVHGARVLEELPERGELLLSLPVVAPGDTVELDVVADGFLRTGAALVRPADGSEAFAEIELARSAVLVAYVHRPERNRVSIAPERFDDSARDFRPAHDIVRHGLNYPNGPDDSFVFSGLTPGRWRAVDEASGLASSEVELFPGEREARVELDLRSVTWVSGRVEVSDPAELARVVVLVEGTDVVPTPRWWLPGARPPEGAYVNEGSFRVRVPGDRPVKLVPWHPWLVPATEGGTIDVREGREGVVLRLVTGDEVRLPVPQLASSRHEGSLRIGRYSGDARGEPIEWRNAPIVDGIARFATLRGTWTLWIDAGESFAPLVLRDVPVEGATTLAPAAFEHGSAVRVRLIVDEGEAAPRVSVSALHTGMPAYFRRLNSGGESEVVLAGLGPGSFRVSASSITRSRTIPERELELDGQSEITLDFDLR